MINFVKMGHSEKFFGRFKYIILLSIKKNLENILYYIHRKGLSFLNFINK